MEVQMQGPSAKRKQHWPDNGPCPNHMIEGLITRYCQDISTVDMVGIKIYSIQSITAFIYTIN